MPPLRSQPDEGFEEEEGQGETAGLSTAGVTSSEVAITSLAHMFESLNQRELDERQERERQHIKILQNQVHQIQPDFEHTRAGITTTG